MPEMTEVTMSGTISIFRARMKRSPTNWQEPRAPETKDSSPPVEVSGEAIRRNTRAVKVASTRAARICQWSAMRGFMQGREADQGPFAKENGEIAPS